MGKINNIPHEIPEDNHDAHVETISKSKVEEHYEDLQR